MTAPHLASDNVAIDAAHQRRMENARNALDAAVAAFHLRPAPRWHLEALIRAAGALRDEAIAGLERAYGRSEGSFGRTASITHTAGPPLHALPGSNHERHADRLAAIEADKDARAEAMFAGPEDGR